jgi:hypothetical protein
MRLTIIADDKRVGVDELFFEPIEMPQLDSAIHAVQWYGNYGEVEYKTQFENGALVKPANLLITDMMPFQFAVDAWNIAKADAEAAQEAAAAIAIEAAAAKTAASVDAESKSDGQQEPGQNDGV